MRELGREAKAPARVYFTGGVTAVLHGWRASTVDVDLRLVPEDDAVYSALPRLKEQLEMNIELASPADFIPELPGWLDRSAFIGQEGLLSFYHYDPYSQALAKIERGHARDALDVAALIDRGLVEPGKLMTLFAAIEPALHRFPSIDPKTFRAAVERAVGQG
jgi:hypothetical protein